MDLHPFGIPSGGKAHCKILERQLLFTWDSNTSICSCSDWDPRIKLFFLRVCTIWANIRMSHISSHKIPQICVVYQASYELHCELYLQVFLAGEKSWFIGEGDGLKGKYFKISEAWESALLWSTQNCFDMLMGHLSLCTRDYVCAQRGKWHLSHSPLPPVCALWQSQLRWAQSVLQSCHILRSTSPSELIVLTC